MWAISTQLIIGEVSSSLIMWCVCVCEERERQTDTETHRDTDRESVSSSSLMSVSQWDLNTQPLCSGAGGGPHEFPLSHY
jgi:hypothetical protein